MIGLLSRLHALKRQRDYLPSLGLNDATPDLATCLTLSFLLLLNEVPLFVFFFFLMTRHPPSSPLFPTPPLSRSRHTRGGFRRAFCRNRQRAWGSLWLASQTPSRRTRPRFRRPSRSSCQRWEVVGGGPRAPARDRKSTRLNSRHLVISYAGFCFEK